LENFEISDISLVQGSPFAAVVPRSYRLDLEKNYFFSKVRVSQVERGGNMQTQTHSYHKLQPSGKKDFDSTRKEGGDRTAMAMEKVERLAAENAVVVFSQSGCCMCHVVKRLFCSLGVGPTVYELDEQSGGSDLEKALLRLVGPAESQAVPAVFVGGKLLGGLDRVMAAHISGTLVPQLKEAGALWL
jgi:glutaredoxin 3